MSYRKWEWLCERLWRSLEEDLNAGSSSPLQQVIDQIPNGERPGFSPGQMWIARPKDGVGLTIPIVLTHVSSVIRGVVVTNDTFIAGHDDLVVSSSESPTATELLLLTWSDSPVDGECLTEYVGDIGSNSMRALLMYLQRRLTGGYTLRALNSGTSQGEEKRVSWSIHPHATPDEVCLFETGPRILDEDDPRFKVREIISRGTYWIADQAAEKLFSAADVPDFTPWHVRVTENLKKVFEEHGRPKEPDLDWMPLSAVAAGALVAGAGIRFIPGVGAIAGVVASLVTVAGVVIAGRGKKAPRPRSADQKKLRPSERVAGVLKVGEIDVELDLLALSDTLFVRARALSGGEVSQGVKISFVSGKKKLSAITKKDGYAQLRLKEIKHEGPQSLIIGGEEGPFVIDLSFTAAEETVIQGAEQNPNVH